MAEAELPRGAFWQTSSGEHPPTEAWERLACGELSSDERETLLEHVVECIACTRIYRALAELERGARRFDPAVPDPGLAASAGAGRRTWRWQLGGVAAAAAAAALAIWVGIRPQARPAATSPAETFRSTPESAAGPILRAPLGVVAAPQVFRWEPVQGAVRYRIDLLDAEGEIAWSAATAETEAAWPASLPAQPGRYYWRVIAELEEGGTAASPLEDFDLRNGPAELP